MNVITDMLDYFYALFYNWNSLDIIILALSLYGMYRLGRKHAQQARPARPAQAVGVVSAGREYNTPAIIRRQDSDK